ncbi:MAG: RdgB/HAM1 family non-canonical purine NTP pyrophosphatase [Lachnospiraceae bacterium]|nr:RdgB/HAM1 family non-canonical purine NTP pyrophosphatase [Lachnospiraceae bacterium]
MNRIIFATQNKGKIVEIKEIMEGCEVVPMSEVGFEGDIEENGTSFEENALIKAKAVWEKTGGLVMADDSGLEVDALGLEPGIYSARYLGRDVPFKEKMDDILRRLEGVADKERTARFVCAVAAVLPDGSSQVVRGTMEGRIGYEQAGDKGFGYDPIVVIPEYGRTVAQLTADEKNAISHRGKALRLMKERLAGGVL